MPDFVFTNPVDGDHEKADLAVIGALLRTRGEDYWNDPDGSGFAGLSYFPEGNGVSPGMVASLAITKLDNVASPYYREPEYYLSYAGGPLTIRSPVNCAGEDRLISTPCSCRWRPPSRPFVGSWSAVSGPRMPAGLPRARWCGRRMLLMGSVITASLARRPRLPYRY